VRKWFKEQIYDPSVVMNKATIQAMVIKDENASKATSLKSLANEVNLISRPTSDTFLVGKR
jgi:hypothetical protein